MTCLRRPISCTGPSRFDEQPPLYPSSLTLSLSIDCRQSIFRDSTFVVASTLPMTVYASSHEQCTASLELYTEYELHSLTADRSFPQCITLVGSLLLLTLAASSGKRYVWHPSVPSAHNNNDNLACKRQYIKDSRGGTRCSHHTNYRLVNSLLVSYLVPRSSYVSQLLNFTAITACVAV